MTRAYFVSDLHLAGPEEPRTQLFERFLDAVERDDLATHLFLLGDIFDMWLGDHAYFIERYRGIVKAIGRLRTRGVEVHYFEGNHDLHLEVFWARELGVSVHPGPVRIDLGRARLRLEHGDQMDPDDRGYIFLRWFLRTPPMRFLILHLPGRLVAWIGERASAHSRNYTSQTKTISQQAAIDKIRRHAKKVHAEDPFDLIISGHVHVRDDIEFETGNGRARSVNLGTWLQAPCYFRLDDVRGELVELGEADVAQLTTPAEAAAQSSP
jgi:UDP-2,3-diacylglucosamine hydrolase